MGFLTPQLPDVDVAAFEQQPREERLKVLTRHWVEHGFGSPYGVYLFYLVKCMLYVGGGMLVIAHFGHLGSVLHPDQWWRRPVVYQLAIIWTLLWEVLGLGCGSGPLTSRFMPPIGGILYWVRPGTIRLPPYPCHLPLTKGDTRQVVDVALYLAVLGSIGWVFQTGSTTALWTVILSLGILGLRDQTIFLAARGEQYWLCLLVIALATGHDQLIAFKIVMLALWWGAATSKLNRHFPFVIATMMSNAPLIQPRSLKRRFYRSHPEDLRPSRLATAVAHIGTATEFGVPLFLVLLGNGGPWTWAAVVYMTLFHLNILSTVPMGVPLEWNVFFIFSLYFLFGAYGDLTLGSLSSPRPLAIVLPSLIVLPVLGNLRPDLVSFLPAMRYYAGNWATSAWLFTGGNAERLQTGLTASTTLPVHQLEALYDADTALIMAQKVQSWRSMHSHGRAHNGLIDRVARGEDVTVVDGELVAGFALGWNFGEGHLHDEQLLAAIQARCHFAPGELRVVMLESQPMFRSWQAYRIVDAATGLLELGKVKVDDMLVRQPWPEIEDYPVYDVTSLAPLHPPTG